VFVQAQITPGENGQERCQLGSQSWLSIGTTDKPIDDGELQSNAPVTVQCEVIPDGDGFRVSASATLAGARGGSVTISGKFTGSGTQGPIRAVFQRGDTGRLEQSDCQVTYDSQYMGVAAGRVWGILRCKTMELSAQNRVCEGSAEFKFENCNQ
jgi:hypothetical protein